MCRKPIFTSGIHNPKLRELVVHRHYSLHYCTEYDDQYAGINGELEECEMQKEEDMELDMDDVLPEKSEGPSTYESSMNN